MRATEAVADWISTQVDLAELAIQRERVMEAELRALRAQISPHFIYNSLAAIASFVRTDPPRARELLLEFADFTRYSLRKSGPMATLSEELANIERYLTCLLYTSGIPDQGGGAGGAGQGRHPRPHHQSLGYRHPMVPSDAGGRDAGDPTDGRSLSRITKMCIRDRSGSARWSWSAQTPHR